MIIRNLRTNTELLAAALFQVRVMIREQDDQIADYGGPIESYSDTSVKIGGTHYMRGGYEFEAQ